MLRKQPYAFTLQKERQEIRKPKKQGFIPSKFLSIKFQTSKKMKKYRCTVCDWIYDPALGDPEGGIAPGTAFEEIPDDWVCPVCGVGKDQFEEVAE